MGPIVMKTVLSVFVLLVFITRVGAGGASTHEDVVKQMLTSLEKMSTTLTSITGQESADAAKPELRKAAGEFGAARTKAEKLPPPSREQKDRLDKEYKGKIEAAKKKLDGEVVRVRNVPGGPDALKEISSVFAKRMK